MTLTIHTLPPCRMRNDRDPIDTTLAPRSLSQWLLFMDSDGTVDIFCRDYYGNDGIPSDEWHNRTLTWGLGQRGDLTCIDRDALAHDLKPDGRLYKLLSRVHAGHTVDWDGSNHVGSLTDDASDAADEIDRLLSSDVYCDSDAPDLWDAYEWLTAGGDNKAADILAYLQLTVDATDDQIEAASDRADDDAAKDGVELADTDDAITRLIDEVRDEMADEDEDEDEDEEAVS